MSEFLRYILLPQIEFLKPLIVPANAPCLYFDHCGNLVQMDCQEHLFNRSWGGHFKSPVICKHCNNVKFSSTIDHAYDDHARWIKNTRGMTVKGKDPTIKVGDQVRIKAFGELSISPGADRSAINLTEVGINPGSTHLSQYQSAAHTCLKALAAYKPELCNHPRFASIKEFIYSNDDKEDWKKFAIVTDIASEFKPDRRQMFIEECHRVTLHFSKKHNRVIGVYNMLGVLERSIVLAEEWDGKEELLIVVENLQKEQPHPDARLRRFNYRAGMPDIIHELEVQLDDSYFKEENASLERYAIALAPSFKFLRHLDNLHDEAPIITDDILLELDRRSIELLERTIYVATGRRISAEEIMQALNNNGYMGYKTKYLGLTVDNVFLREIGLIHRRASKEIAPDAIQLE